MTRTGFDLDQPIPKVVIDAILKDIALVSPALAVIISNLKVTESYSIEFAAISEDGNMNINPLGAVLIARMGFIQDDYLALRNYIALLAYALSKLDRYEEVITELHAAIESLKKSDPKIVESAKAFGEWLTQYVSRNVSLDAQQFANNVSVYLLVPLVLHEILHIALDHTARAAKIFRDYGISPEAYGQFAIEFCK